MARAHFISWESGISSTLATLSIGLAAAVMMSSCQHAPELSYATSAPVVQKRSELATELLELLPMEQRGSAAAEEAYWLADTAYKASASIARLNEPLLWPAVMNNRLVNAPFNIRERGLCWHYQHDLYRELRRRKLNYFRLGCCVRDRGTGSEHNCVYVAAKDDVWPNAITLDAWLKNGRLSTFSQSELDQEDWADRAETAYLLDMIYPENHSYPIEHWAMVKSGKKWNLYLPTWTDEGRNTRQGQIMLRNMYNGLQKRNGKLTDY